MRRGPQPAAEIPMRIAVIDIGGSNIKFYSPEGVKTKVESGPELTPEAFFAKTRPLLEEHRAEAVSIGFPSIVRDGVVRVEPTNLGVGWVGEDFAPLTDLPRKVLNDAAMQAVGGYNGGRMLFLGFGTGLGSALVENDVILPLELCELRYSKKRTIEEVVCKEALKEVGREKWNHRVGKVVDMLRQAFLPDEILVGGGNAKRIDPLPDGVRIGGNRDALEGGRRLWTRG